MMITGPQVTKVNLFERLKSIKDTLKPPVANAMFFNNALKVMFLGGPNNRDDYHIEMGEELFIQLVGDIDLKIIDPFTNLPRTIHIAEGEMFLLPAGIPHSPQRYANTVGLVFERDRLADDVDCLRWYQGKDNEHNLDILYQEFFHCEDLGCQIRECIERYQQHLSQGALIDMNDKVNENNQSNNIKSLLKLIERAKVDAFIQPTIQLRKLIAVQQEDHDVNSKVLYDSEFSLILYKAGCHEIAFPKLLREIFFWQQCGQSRIRFVTNNCENNAKENNQTVDLSEGEVLLLSSDSVGEVVMIDCHSPESALLAISNKFMMGDHHNKIDPAGH